MKIIPTFAPPVISLAFKDSNLSIKEINTRNGSRYRNSRTVLMALSVLTISLISVAAHATQAAWVFAHRINNVESVQAASRDQGINAIEIDITLRSKVKENKRGACTKIWCAFHKRSGPASADPQASNLSTILEHLRRSGSLHAVWLDVKTLDAKPKDYRNLYSLVRTKLQASAGKPATRKFWGVYPGTATNTPYVKTLINNLPKIGPKSENTLIININNPDDAKRANRVCKKHNLQCGVSSGHSLSGGPLGGDGKHIKAVNGSLALTNINSVFMWTFNWSGHSEDDLMRLLFRDRSYGEKIAGLKRHCGQEGNGVIVGPTTKIYTANFCRTADKGDACSFASREIANGPNRMGNLNSNISRPRSGYSNADC